MNYTEAEILEKAKQILNDFNPQHFDEKRIEKIRFSVDNVAREDRSKIIPAWIVSIHEPVFDNYTFLAIADETGEPLYIQNKHMAKNIVRTGDGKYTTV